MTVIVIGGGIAGLSTALALVRLGASKVRLLEREQHLFSCSSGSNAAIYRSLELISGVGMLALRSGEILDELFAGRVGWLRPRPLWLVAPSREELGPLIAEARRSNIAHRLEEALQRVCPQLKGGSAEAGLVLPDAGVLDVHAIATTLRQRFCEAGGELRLGCEVGQIVLEADRVAGVTLRDGQLLESDAVVIAAGAWSAPLGRACGGGLALTPLLRHLALLEPEQPVSPLDDTIWDVAQAAYFRPESGGLLASPGDEREWPSAPPLAQPEALELLATKLARLAPTLAGSRVKRYWACLRTFTPDRAAVLGADPRIHGLHWAAALGGFGMSTGVAAGELVAQGVLASENIVPSALSVARLTKSPGAKLAT